MRINLDTLTVEQLYGLKEALSRLTVFGPWTKRTEGRFVRPEPANADGRVSVWYCDGSYDLAAGWYYRIGFGVVGIGGVTGTVAHERAEDCMIAADECLAGVPDVRLVGIAPKAQAVEEKPGRDTATTAVTAGGED